MHDDAAFFGLDRVGDASWRFDVTERLTTPFRFLYGGSAMAVAAVVTQQATARRVVWLTTQYAANANLGDTVDVTVDVATAGKRTSQARVVARVGDHEVFAAVAALGDDRNVELSGTWVQMPEVARPDDCPAGEPPPGAPDCFMHLIERRVAGEPLSFGLPLSVGRVGEAHAAGWIKVSGEDSTTAPMLGFLADCAPMAFAVAAGGLLFGTSLDNTIRVHEQRPAEWILADARAIAAARGYGYADVHLWTPDGHLLATGSQTCVLRKPPGMIAP